MLLGMKYLSHINLLGAVHSRSLGNPAACLAETTGMLPGLLGGVLFCSSGVYTGKGVPEGIRALHHRACGEGVPDGGCGHNLSRSTCDPAPLLSAGRRTWRGPFLSWGPSRKAHGLKETWSGWVLEMSVTEWRTRNLSLWVHMGQ